MILKFCAISGDGIGPEIMAAAIKVLEAVAKRFDHTLEIEQAWAGGEAYDLFENHLPQETIDIASGCKAILFGSVGGPVHEQMNPKWKGCEANSILALRKAFSFFANERPVVFYESLRALSPVKVEGDIDLIIIRELLGDVYFGDHTITGEGTARVASDSGSYSVAQIERIARHGFQLAQTRRKKLTSVDKANVLSMSKLWREVVDKVAKDFPDVQYEHVLVDSCAMHLVTKPQAFDVVLAPNLFGDILSDLAASLPGSLGLLPSASFNAEGFALYEPSGGSAPDIAGKGIANPIAQILSAAMMLRSTFRLPTEASVIENAVRTVLASGKLTADLLPSDKLHSALSTMQCAQEVIKQIESM